MKYVAVIVGILVVVYLLKRGLVANASLQAAQNPPGWGSGQLWGPGGPMPRYPYGYNPPWYDALSGSFQNKNFGFQFGA
jgi:hypothetical protein